jgi:hypothetical protein
MWSIWDSFELGYLFGRKTLGFHSSFPRRAYQRLGYLNFKENMVPPVTFKHLIAFRLGMISGRVVACLMSLVTRTFT